MFLPNQRNPSKQTSLYEEKRKTEKKKASLLFRWWRRLKSRGTLLSSRDGRLACQDGALGAKQEQVPVAGDRVEQRDLELGSNPEGKGKKKKKAKPQVKQHSQSASYLPMYKCKAVEADGWALLCFALGWLDWNLRACANVGGWESTVI